MDRAQFVVQLINRVTAPARMMARSLSGLDKKLRALNTANATKVGEALADWQKRVPWGAIHAGLDGFRKRLFSAAKEAAILGAAVTALGTFFVTKGVVDAAVFAEKSRAAFATLTGSTSEGEVAFQRAIRLANTYGLSIQDTTKNLIKLRAAQFSLEQGEELIKLSTDLRSIGASAFEVENAIRAITQIKAKGRLQAEELVGQLAEAGVATTLVYDALGKRLGKTTDQVRKLITAGKIDADTGIAAIMDAVLKKTNSKQAGEAGKRFADSTLGGMLERLKNAPSNAFFRISEASGSALGNLRPIIQDITRSIENIDARSVADFVGAVLTAVREAVPLIKEFAAGFASGFTEMLAAMKVGGASDDLKTRFFELGQVVAKFVELGVKGMKLFVDVVTAVTGPVGRVTAAIAGIGFVVFKLVSWIGIAAKFFGIAAAAVGNWAAGLVALKAVALAVVGAVVWVASGIAAVVAAIATAPVTITVAIAAAIAAAATGLVYLLVEYGDKIGEFFSWLGEASFKAGKDLIYGLINGMKAVGGGLWMAAQGIGGSLVDAFKAVFQINSPSRVFEGIGRQNMAGIEQGMRLAEPAAATPSPGVRSRSPVEVHLYFSGSAPTGATDREALGKTVERGVRKGMQQSMATPGA